MRDIPMHIRFSQQLMDDLNHSLSSVLAAKGIVNVPLLAEEIRSRNEGENVALEDIEAQVMAKAQLLSCAMEFDSRFSS